MTLCALALLFSLLTVGCGPEDPPPHPDTFQMDTGPTDTTVGGEARTLENCETTIAEDVPAFYKKYFHCVDISMSGDSVEITSTGLPPHPSPYYAATDPNYVEFDTSGGRRKNPNGIGAVAQTMTIAASPSAKGLNINDALVDGQPNSDEEYNLGTAGVALNGTLMFNGTAAPGDELEAERETFDQYEGHPQQSGQYHYHTQSPGPLGVLERAGIVTSTVPGSAEVELYAIMCDGTLILGCTELDGSAPNSGDFDAQNGHVHDITDDEATYFQGRYHTHLCAALGHEFAPEIQFYEDCGASGR